MNANNDNNLFQQYDGNPLIVDNERMRRQQLMRFTLIICLLFLLLSNDNTSNRNKNHPVSKADVVNKIYLKEEYNKKLNNILQDNYKIIQNHDPTNYIIKNADSFPINVTGLYRGAWSEMIDYNLMSITINEEDNLKHHVDIDKRFIKTDSRLNSGSSLLQLVMIPLQDVSDLSFVYGVIRLYESDDIELGYPLQGVYINSQRKLTLFATPYASQQLFIAISSKAAKNFTTTNDIASTTPSSTATALLSSAATSDSLPFVSSTTNIASHTTNASNNLNHIDSDSAIHRQQLHSTSITTPIVLSTSTSSSTRTNVYNILPQVVAPSILLKKYLSYLQSFLIIYMNSFVNKYVIPPNLSNLFHIAPVLDLFTSSITPQSLLPKEQRSSHYITRKLIDIHSKDTDTTIHTNSATTNSTTTTTTTDMDSTTTITTTTKNQSQRIADSVVLLTDPDTEYGEIKLVLSNLESSETLINQYNLNSITSSSNSNTSNNNDNNNTNRNTSVDSYFYLFPIGANVLPLKFKTLQSIASSPTFNTSIDSIIIKQKKSKIACPYSFQFTVLPHDNVIDKISRNSQYELNVIDQSLTKSSASKSSNTSTIITLSTSKMISANAIGGAMTSNTCSKDIQVFATAYEIQIDRLKYTAENYAFGIGLICILQVLLLVYQLKQCSTLAISSRISILSVFAQSLLDALLCVGHLLLAISIPNVFFAAFIWISLTKLLMFSVFHMRVIINIYQARYSQEISLEGWQGLRNRLIQLHLRFYVAMMICIFLAYTLPYSPAIIVLGLYSFWIPQIIYNAYSGTKYPINIIYVISVTLLRLFIPLYLLSFPYNFVSMLSAYMEPPSHLYIPGVLKDTVVNANYLSSSASLLLIVWTSAQVLSLHYQNKYGPRFFIPKAWLPYRYDYHRVIPHHLYRTNSNSSNSSNNMMNDNSITSEIELSSHHSSYSSPYYSRESNDDDIETGLALLEDDGHGLECVICYNNINLNARNYMITPCDHVFHKDCLLQWVNVKSECPVCRQALPTTEID